MTPRQVSKDQRRLKEKTEKEVIETAKGRENKEKEMELEKVYSTMFFLLQFVMSFLQEQKDKHVKEIHELPCLKRKLVHSALPCISSVDKKQIRQTQRMD